MPVTAGVEPGTEQPARDGAPDAEPAVPDLQGRDRVAALAEVQVVVGGDVVEPGADEPAGTAQSAMSPTCPETPPRATQRFSPTQTAATTPRMIASA